MAYKQTAAQDYFEIQQTIARYALGQDSHQGSDGSITSDWESVFTDDGMTDYSAAGAPCCSFRELAVWMRGSETQTGRMSAFSGWQHMLSLPVVSVDGDKAVARTDYLAIHRLNDRSGRFDAAGAFHDDLVRTADGWRIKKRRLEVYFGDELVLVNAGARS